MAHHQGGREERKAKREAGLDRMDQREIDFNDLNSPGGMEQPEFAEKYGQRQRGGPNSNPYFGYSKENLLKVRAAEALEAEVAEELDVPDPSPEDADDVLNS